MGNETEYTLDNIHKFFDNLDNALNPNMRKMMVWAEYEHDRQLNAKLREIEKLYENNDRPSEHYQAFQITSDVFVVEYSRRGETLGYLPCVKLSTNHFKHPNILYSSLDECVIAAYSILYTGHEDAGAWACKLMNIGVGEE